MSRDVSVRLSANTSAYIAGMGRAAGATDKLEGSLARVHARGLTTEQAIDRVGKVSGTAFLAGAAAIGYAEKKAADFNAEMATVNTLSHANAKQQDLLAKAAKGVGVNIGFSATQSAEAEEELVKAGVKVRKILGGGLKGALDLAAAGQTSVADATSVAASAMTQFNLKGRDVPHIADLLAAGADKALGSVTDLGYGLAQVGTVAHQMGFSIEATTGTLAEFAQNGLLGEKGGAALKQMFLRLANPTKKSQELMDQYGLSLYKANGQIKTLPELAGNLQKSFEKLTPAQRNAALGTIFGSRAIQAANILVKDGEKGNRKWIKSVDDQGFAAHQAAGKMDSLKGDVKKLTAQFDNAFINASGKQNFLREIAQDGTKAIAVYNKLSDAQRGAIDKAIVYGTAGAGAVYAATKLYKVGKGASELLKFAVGGSRAAKSVTAVESAFGSRVFVTNWPPGLLAGGKVPGVPGIPDVPSKTATEKAAAKDALKKLGPVGAALAGGSFAIPGILGAGVSLGDRNNETHPVRGTDKLQALDTRLSKLSFKDPAAGAAEFNKYVEKSGLSIDTLNKALPKTASALDKTYGSQHALNTMLQGTARAAGIAGLGVHGYQTRLESLPPQVQTKITAPGFQATSANIKKLQHQYGLTKPQLRTVIRLLGGQAAIAQANAVDARLNRLQGKSVNTYIHTITSSSGVGSKKPAQNLGGLLGGKHARGGLITGPGGPRDDRIPAWLSDGEFVVNAAATSQNRALLEAINGPAGPNGTGGFAAGGPVDARRHPGKDKDETHPTRKRLKELEAALKKATTAVDKETAARDAVVQKRNDLKSAVTDKFTSDPFATPTNVWAASGVGGADAIVKGDTAKAKAFLAVLIQLKKDGLTNDALASIAQTGDIGQAKALLAGGAAGVKKYQSDFNQRASVVGSVAQYAGTAAYGAQQAKAQAVLNASLAEQKKLNTKVDALTKELKGHPEKTGAAVAKGVNKAAVAGSKKH